MNHLIDQFNTADQMNADGLVLHLPKNTPEIVAKYVAQIPRHTTPLILEMPSMHAHETSTYETPKKINNLIKILNKVISN